MQMNKKQQQVYSEEFKKGVLEKRIKAARETMKIVNIDYAKIKQKYYKLLDSIKQTQNLFQGQVEFKPSYYIQCIIGTEMNRNGKQCPFEKMLSAVTRKCDAEDIDKDSIMYIEQDIKQAQICVYDMEYENDIIQKQIDSLFENMEILPFK